MRSRRARANARLNQRRARRATSASAAGHAQRDPRRGYDGACTQLAASRHHRAGAACARQTVQFTTEPARRGALENGAVQIERGPRAARPPRRVRRRPRFCAQARERDAEPRKIRRAAAGLDHPSTAISRRRARGAGAVHVCADDQRAAATEDLEEALGDTLRTLDGAGRTSSTRSRIRRPTYRAGRLQSPAAAPASATPRLLRSATASMVINAASPSTRRRGPTFRTNSSAAAKSGPSKRSDRYLSDGRRAHVDEDETSDNELYAASSWRGSSPARRRRGRAHRERRSCATFSEALALGM